MNTKDFIRLGAPLGEAVQPATGLLWQMPTLLLSSRQNADAQKLWRACIAEKWKVIHLHGWRVPGIAPQDVAVYGEPLFAQHVAQTFGLRLQPDNISRGTQVVALVEIRGPNKSLVYPRGGRFESKRTGNDCSASRVE